MDKIRFEPQMFKFDIDNEATMTCKIIVNDENFIEIIKRIETPMATLNGEADIAGSYAYLPIDDLLDELNLDGCEDETKQAILLGCTCGCAECWPLYAQIEKRENVIIWYKFSNPFRNWDYSQLAPFIFDVTEFEKELMRLKRMIREQIRR